MTKADDAARVAEIKARYSKPYDVVDEADIPYLLGRVEALEAEKDLLNEKWQTATGLEIGGDPFHVTPEVLERHMAKLEAENARLREVFDAAKVWLAYENCEPGDEEFALAVRAALRGEGGPR